MLRHISLQALALVAGAATASAGVLIVGTYTGTKTPKGRTVEFRIQDGRGKISSQPGQFIYYDHAKRTAYIVDTDKGTSFEMNEARAKQMGAQLADAQRMMEAKLKEMPPDQRAMVEKMMKEQGGGLPPPATVAPSRSVRRRPRRSGSPWGTWRSSKGFSISPRKWLARSGPRGGWGVLPSADSAGSRSSAPNPTTARSPTASR